MSAVRLPLLLLGLLPLLAAASHGADLPRLKIPRTPAAPRMTADPDDPAWRAAARIPALGPALGESPSAGRPTSVLALRAGDVLFVRFLCDDRDLYVPPPSPDGALYRGSVVEVFLDPEGRQRSWDEIEVNPLGETAQVRYGLDGPPLAGPDRILLPAARAGLRKDGAFRLPGLAVAVSRSRGLWITDLALPLGNPAGAVRANFLRYEWPEGAGGSRTLVPANWSPVRNGCPHLSPGAMGFLEFVP